MPPWSGYLWRHIKTPNSQHGCTKQPTWLHRCHAPSETGTSNYHLVPQTNPRYNIAYISNMNTKKKSCQTCDSSHVLLCTIRASHQMHKLFLTVVNSTVIECSGQTSPIHIYLLYMLRAKENIPISFFPTGMDVLHYFRLAEVFSACSDIL